MPKTSPRGSAPNRQIVETGANILIFRGKAIHFGFFVFKEKGDSVFDFSIPEPPFW